MGKYSEQPEWTTEDSEADIECPNCGASNLIKYEQGKPALFTCHSCYAGIEVLVTLKAAIGPREYNAS